MHMHVMIICMDNVMKFADLICFHNKGVSLISLNSLKTA